MATQDTAVARDPIYGNLAINWKWMLALGILMIVLGVIGLGMAYLLTILSVLWFGVLAVVGGVAQVIDAFKFAGWKSTAAHILLGLLYVGAGVVLIVLPVQSAWWLTLLIGASFIVTGVLRMVMAFQMHGSGSAFFWLIVSSLLSIGLGVLIFGIVDFPAEGALSTPEAAATWFGEWGWVIGLFVAIEFIIHGASLAALAVAARNRGDAPPPAPSEPSASAAA